MPRIRSLSSSTSGRVRRQASESAALTSHKDTANTAAVSDTARPDDGVNDVVPEPAGGADTAPDLGGGFEERELRAGQLLVVPAVLGPQDLHGAGDQDVADPLESTFLPPRRDDTAARAARRLVSFDNDLAPAVLQDGGRDDGVVEQVEDAGGSVRRRPRWAQSRLVVPFLVECWTHSSQQGHGPPFLAATRNQFPRTTKRQQSRGP